MLSKRFSPCPSVLVATLALGLSGCVAAPFAQMAVSQMMPAKPPCMPGPGCQTDRTRSAMSDISKGVTDSFSKLIGSPSDVQTLATSAPAK
jgi:hypothetical protein